jgi:hypothetical protein
MTEGLLFLKALIKARRLHAVIDRTYPLDKMVAAYPYV